LEAYAYEENPSAYPKDVQHLIRQQNKIGWQQLCWGDSVRNGGVLCKIITAYAQHAAETAEAEQTKKKTKKQTGGQRWQVAISGILWDQWWAIWDSQNKDLFGKDAR
jgi:hypothetical protein